jgi:hypothetical protein
MKMEEENVPDIINGEYISVHGPIPGAARDRAEHLSEKITARATWCLPAEGDVVICHGRNSKIYPSAHLEHSTFSPTGWTVCIHPMEPFVTGDLQVSASGGNWCTCDPEKLEYVGKARKVFWTWANRPTASGGIYFWATVSVWKYSDDNIY